MHIEIALVADSLGLKIADVGRDSLVALFLHLSLLLPICLEVFCLLVEIDRIQLAEELIWDRAITNEHEKYVIESTFCCEIGEPHLRIVQFYNAEAPEKINLVKWDQGSLENLAGYNKILHRLHSVKICFYSN